MWYPDSYVVVPGSATNDDAPNAATNDASTAAANDVPTPIAEYVDDEWIAYDAAKPNDITCRWASSRTNAIPTTVNVPTDSSIEQWRRHESQNKRRPQLHDEELIQSVAKLGIVFIRCPIGHEAKLNLKRLLLVLNIY